MDGVGLVLEGGGMRGMFTAGVIDVLLERDVALDAVVGVSAGACFGCNYPSHQIGRPMRYNLAYSRDARYCSVRSLIRTGDLFGADFCYRELPFELDPMDEEAFAASGIPFWCVATSVETGEACYHVATEVDEELLLWIRASASMPVVSRPVEICGATYLDGGIADPIPLRFAQAQGFEKNVVVLTQPKDYVKREGRLSPLMRLALRAQPAVMRSMERRPAVYNEEHAFAFAQEREGRTLVLAPDEALPAGRIEHDAEKLCATYLEGRRVAERELTRIVAFATGKGGRV